MFTPTSPHPRTSQPWLVIRESTWKPTGGVWHPRGAAAAETADITRWQERIARVVTNPLPRMPDADRRGCSDLIKPPTLAASRQPSRHACPLSSELSPKPPHLPPTTRIPAVPSLKKTLYENRETEPPTTKARAGARQKSYTYTPRVTVTKADGSSGASKLPGVSTLQALDNHAVLRSAGTPG